MTILPDDVSELFPPVRPQFAEARNPRRKKAAPKKKVAPAKRKRARPAGGRERPTGAGQRPPKADPPGGSPAAPQLYDVAFPGSHEDFPPPAFLSIAAKGKWVEIVPVLLERKDRGGQKLLDQVTRDSLAIFCDAWGQFDQACRLLNGLASPFITVGNGALQAHPALALKKAAWAEIRNSAKLLGLNPISRQQLKATKTGATDAVAAIIGGD